jgi:hypothetical protein
MDPEEREQKLANFGEGYNRLESALGSFPRQMWDFKPSPESWSIREIIAHIVDSEANGYIRIRKCIAEPGAPVMAYDGDRWAEALQYKEQAVDQALDVFKVIRESTYRLLQAQPEEIWTNTVSHPDYDEPLTLVDLLGIYERHVPAHIEQMGQNHNAWLAQNSAASAISGAR